MTPARRIGWKIAGCLVVLVIASWHAYARAEDAAPTKPGIEPFIKMRWPGAAELAPDQTLYFVYDPDGIRQLYKLAPGKPQSEAVKLTSFADGIGGYSLSEDGRWIAITASAGGSEQADLFLMDATTGQMQTLFESPEFVYTGVVWRRDSQAFAFRANDENATDFHVYVYDVRDKTRKKVFAEKGHNYPSAFNQDGTKVVVGRYNSASYSQLFEVDLTTGESREITPKGEEWSFEPVGYIKGDGTFLVNTNYKRDLMGVHEIDLASGQVNPVLSDLDGHEIDFAALNFEGTILAVGINEDGYRTLSLRQTASYAPLPMPKLDKGIVGNVAFRNRSMLYSLENARTPGIVYRWDLGSPNVPPTSLTEADTQGIDVSKFRLPELVHYPSFDKTKIPAFLYLPPDYEKGKKIPFIVYYHGGPEGQFRPYFNRSFQYFLSRGYGVIAPNVRGSSGYGKAYIEADNYKNRDKSVKDGVWAAKYVIDQGYTEPKKIAAWGGSYGGFMVMATITQAPQVFGAACNVVGVVNFETFLQQTKSYRRALREAEYGPLSDPEFLRSISPIHKLDKIDTPLMLAHGLNDPRVPIGEAMQIAVALKKRGLDVEELYFPDEGHGFAKEENRLLYYQRMAKFFDEHLMK